MYRMDKSMHANSSNAEDAVNIILCTSGALKTSVVKIMKNPNSAKSSTSTALSRITSPNIKVELILSPFPSTNALINSPRRRVGEH